MKREFECMEDLQDAYDNLEDENTKLNSELSEIYKTLTPLINAWTTYKLNNPSVDPRDPDVKELDFLFDIMRELE